MNIKEMLVEIVKCVCFVGGTEMGGATWFLRELFLVIICYSIVCYSLMKIAPKANIAIIQGIISVVFLMLGFLLQRLNLPHSYSVGTMLSTYILYHLGTEFGKMKFRETLKSKRFLLYFISAVILSVLNEFCTIGLINNNYTNPVFFLLCSISGWILLYGIAELINKSTVFTKIFSYLGMHTMSIIFLHFMCFKFINYFFTRVENLDVRYAAAFPVLVVGKWQWILYSVAGIFVPLIFEYVYHMVKNKFYTDIKNIHCRRMR